MQEQEQDQEIIEIDTFEDFLGLWPTLKIVAQVCNVPSNNVVQWKRRNSIPVLYWRRLLQDLHQRGLTGLSVDDLVDIVVGSYEDEAG
jgi:hypothetical protein